MIVLLFVCGAYQCSVQCGSSLAERMTLLIHSNVLTGAVSCAFLVCRHACEAAADGAGSSDPDDPQRRNFPGRSTGVGANTPQAGDVT